MINRIASNCIYFKMACFQWKPPLLLTLYYFISLYFFYFCMGALFYGCLFSSFFSAGTSLQGFGSNIFNKKSLQLALTSAKRVQGYIYSLIPVSKVNPLSHGINCMSIIIFIQTHFFLLLLTAKCTFLGCVEYGSLTLTVWGSFGRFFFLT